MTPLEIIITTFGIMMAITIPIILLIVVTLWAINYFC